jgi:Tol biopolymer transport system component
VKDGRIQTLDPLSGAVTRVSGKLDARNLAWSPDGTRIAFEIDVPGVGQGISVLNLANENVVAVSEEMSGLDQEWVLGFEHPSWSPDGSRLAFAASLMSTDGECAAGATASGFDLGAMACYRSYIYVLELADGSVRQVTDGDVVDIDPAWSPDGATIAFVRFSQPTLETPDPRPEILGLDPDGGAVRSLIAGEDFYGTSPDWSPDSGRLIVLNGESQISVVDLLRSDATALLSPSDSDSRVDEPTWSPDGELILFTRVTGEAERVIMVDQHGGEEREIVDGCCASWQPVIGSAGTS